MNLVFLSASPYWLNRKKRGGITYQAGRKMTRSDVFIWKEQEWSKKRNKYIILFISKN
jgi:hypothetical protein